MKKLAVVYFSKNGSTQKMAEQIALGAQSISDIEAKTFSIENADMEYIKTADGIIVGTPTYEGILSGKLKLWLEEKLCSIPLKNKIGGSFATAHYIHGGADIAMISIFSHMLSKGMMIYSSGESFGNPVIHYGPVGIDSELVSYSGLFKIYGKRFAENLAVWNH